MGPTFQKYFFQVIIYFDYSATNISYFIIAQLANIRLKYSLAGTVDARFQSVPTCFYFRHREELIDAVRGEPGVTRKIILLSWSNRQALLFVETSLE
jgi:hypothetical protein